MEISKQTVDAAKALANQFKSFMEVADFIIEMEKIQTYVRDLKKSREEVLAETEKARSDLENVQGALVSARSRLKGVKQSADAEQERADGLVNALLSRAKEDASNIVGKAKADAAEIEDAAHDLMRKTRAEVESMGREKAALKEEIANFHSELAELKRRIGV